MATAKSTPVMEQHAQAKRAYPDALLFFRLGDFYEMFGQDAIVGARVLNLTLTSRDKGKPNEVPMAGVPHHAAHAYIAKLIDAGYQVALCEQMADPKLCKGIVPRQVVRVITPGLFTDQEHLRARENNWLAALHVGSNEVGLCLLDLSTSELRAALMPNLAAALAALVHASPREVLVGREENAVASALESVRTTLAGVTVRLDEALSEPELATSLGELVRDAANSSAAVRWACGRALRYARRCTPGVPLPVRAIGSWAPSQTMALDANAQRHLELVQSNVGNPQATLLGVLDLTDSPAGARLLRRRLLAPLLDIELIEARLDAVQVFVEHAEQRRELKRWLSQLGDLERLVTRVALGEGSPKDLGAIRDGLAAAAGCARQLALLSPSQRERLHLGVELDVLPELCERLSAALVDRPPALNKEGAIFRDDYDSQLSRLAHIRREGAGLIVALEARLREETAISGLKARHTRVFGWYLEVSRGSLGKVPKSWRRKQTVAGGERFTSDELDELAHSVASAEDEHRQRELELLKELYAAVSQQAAAIHVLCEHLAHLDVSAALAEAAHRHEYTRPTLTRDRQLHVEEGRHPVVERLAAGGGFVPNDVHLDPEQARFWIITGPNMAGKSTFLRQVALITVMAQLGSFVPARKATIGLVDRVLSRVGASDNLAQGESTFMVEMRETAEILRHATPSSLVILDEIGRGTSTFDGLSIAWAVAEHLDTVCRCRALFATHYHELTALAEQSEFIDNYSVSAREQGSDIVFLHRLTHGPASQSYGVAVAKLAGLPEAVVGRAAALLHSFEGRAEADAQANTPARLSATKSRRSANRDQLDLFGVTRRSESESVHLPRPGTPAVAAERAVIDVLRQTDLDRLAPLQALQLLADLKGKL